MKHFINFFTALALTVLIGVNVAYSQTTIDSGTCGSTLTWKLTTDSTLTISGSGAMDDYESYPNFNYAPWYSYRNTIRTIVIDNGVTTIGDEAFEDCGNLITVTLPNSLVSIGKSAFGWCTRLNPITLPNSLISIGDMAFSNCYRFTSITIPYNVTHIAMLLVGANLFIQQIWAEHIHVILTALVPQRPLFQVLRH